jgi:GTPase SAR1 family protein
VRDSSAVVIAFDLAARASFDHLQSWIDFVRSQGDYPCVIIGTKDDLLANDDIAFEAATFAERAGMDFFATSSFSGKGIEATLIAVQALAVAQPVRARPAVFSDSENIEQDDMSAKGGCC